MKFPQWIKTSALISATVLTAGIGTIAYMAHTARNDMRETLDKIDTEKAVRILAGQKQDKKAAARVLKDMDIHSELNFFCGPHIAKKIEDFKDKDGKKLISQRGDQFVVWQSGEEKEQTLENILSVIDPEKKTQVCVTYDIQNKDLVFHFGGTDFTNLYDLSAATTSLTGSLNPRSAQGASYADSAIHILLKNHPELRPEDVTTSIVAHSSGAAVVPTAMLSLAENGFFTNAAYLLAPCGGKAAFDAASDMTGIDCDVLTKNTVTINSDKKGALDYFAEASATVGKKEYHVINGHMGRHFVEAFNKQKFTK